MISTEQYDCIALLGYMAAIAILALGIGRRPKNGG